MLQNCEFSIETGVNSKKSVMMTSQDISLSLIPTIFRFLMHVIAGEPLVVIITYIHHSFIEMVHQLHFMAVQK